MLSFDTATEWEAAHQDRHWGRWPNENLVRFVSKHYGASKGKARFLEIGCGAGAQLRFLASEGYEAWGIDQSPKAVERASDLLALEGLDDLAFATQQSIFDLTAIDPPFDCLIDVACLQHVHFDKAKALLQRARGWLTPKGRIFSLMAAADGDHESVGGHGYVRMAFLHEIESMFAGYSVEIGHEAITRPGGLKVANWIVHAVKPSDG